MLACLAQPRAFKGAWLQNDCGVVMSRLPLWHIRWCSASGHKQLSALAGCTQSVGLGCLPSVGTVSFVRCASAMQLCLALVVGPGCAMLVQYLCGSYRLKNKVCRSCSGRQASAPCVTFPLWKCLRWQCHRWQCLRSCVCNKKL